MNLNPLPETYFDPQLPLYFTPFFFLIAILLYLFVRKKSEFKDVQNHITYWIIFFFFLLILWTFLTMKFVEKETNIFSDLLCKALPDIVQIDSLKNRCIPQP